MKPSNTLLSLPDVKEADKKVVVAKRDDEEPKRKIIKSLKKI
jgi:hypothetical protein